MKKLLTVFLLATGMIFAQFSVGVHIGPMPRVRVEHQSRRPNARSVWVTGHWDVVNARYAWHPGYWTEPPYDGAIWYAPTHDGNLYHDGYWKGRDGRVEHDGKHRY